MPEYEMTVTDGALDALRRGLTENPAAAINALAGRDPNTYEFTHDALVERACNDNDVLAFMRDGRKLYAIKRLREIAGLGLMEAKNAIEDPRVEAASLAPWVYVVQDIEGERMEVYLDEDTADGRVQEINERMDEGYAFKDTIKALARGQRPIHPHNGI